MIRTLRMFSPLLLRPIVLLSITGLTVIAVAAYGMKIEENIWSVALGVPVIAGVWLRIIREDSLSFRVLWVAPEFRERLFQLEIAIVVVLTVLVGASHFSEQGLLFAVEAVALALLVFVLVDGEHWRDQLTWPAIILRIAVVAGLAKPDWARAVLESQPLLMTVAMLAAVAALRTGSRLTAAARRLINAPATVLFEASDVHAADAPQPTQAASGHRSSIGDEERASLWQSTGIGWMRAAYYEPGVGWRLYLFLLALAVFASLWTNGIFVMFAYQYLGAASLRLRLKAHYPLSRQRRLRIHILLSQVSLLVAVLALGASALVAGRIESLWGGSGMTFLGMNGILVHGALMVGMAPMVQFPRKERSLNPIGNRVLGVWSFGVAVILHFVVLASFVAVRFIVPGLQLLWYVIAVAIIGQIVNWQRLRLHYAHGDLI